MHYVSVVKQFYTLAEQGYIKVDDAVQLISYDSLLLFWPVQALCSLKGWHCQDSFVKVKVQTCASQKLKSGSVNGGPGVNGAQLAALSLETKMLPNYERILFQL